MLFVMSIGKACRTHCEAPPELFLLSHNLISILILKTNSLLLFLFHM